MYSIKSIFLIGLVTLTACNSSSKDSEDTGFDLGTADAGTANDGDADGSGDDDGSEPENAAPLVIVSLNCINNE